MKIPNPRLIVASPTNLIASWEIEVAVVASVFLIASYWLFAYRGGRDDDVGGVVNGRFRLMQNLDSSDAIFDKEKDCLVDGDCSSLWHVAKAIHELEFSFGVISKVRAKGKASVRVADILNHMQVEETVNSNDVGRPEVDTLILLDREVDIVTPMCTQLTYEGLIDELYTCLSYVVPSSRNPMWGEEFNFPTDELPVKFIQKS